MGVFHRRIVHQSAAFSADRLERQIGVLLGQQDRHAFRIKTADRLEYFLHDPRDEADRWFIQRKEARQRRCRDPFKSAYACGGTAPVRCVIS
jgi:hypothetical protein